MLQLLENVDLAQDVIGRAAQHPTCSCWGCYDCTSEGLLVHYFHGELTGEICLEEHKKHIPTRASEHSFEVFDKKKFLYFQDNKLCYLHNNRLSLFFIYIRPNGFDWYVQVFSVSRKVISVSRQDLLNNPPFQERGRFCSRYNRVEIVK